MLTEQDITDELSRKLLDGASLVYFDGRQTAAALVVARAAKAAGIPIVVEAERLRQDLEMLMAEADILVTSGHFPEDWTGEEHVGDAVLATMLRLPTVKWMVR
jgi:sugar/nucleoside kinase (ribokinase family)